MMAVWLDALAAAEREGRPAVLVTVLSTKGSTPREAGAKMVISAEGLAGTIGGGNLEHQCEAVARTLLADTTNTVLTRDFPLGPALGQCCGGHVSVLFEVLRPPPLHIALFGAGHVGRALVKLLGDLPCRVSWIDPRPEALPANLPPNVTPLRTARPAQAVPSLPARSLVLVMTHDHQLDFDIVAVALGRSDLLAVGLIGSASKRARFASRLLRQGIGSTALQRLMCPIGLPGIAGKEPAVVAVSVAAQILQLRSDVESAGGSEGSETSQRSIAAMPASGTAGRSCGDCVCPPVAVEHR